MRAVIACVAVCAVVLAGSPEVAAERTAASAPAVATGMMAAASCAARTDGQASAAATTSGNDDGSGSFGRWTRDEDGLPAYDFRDRTDLPRPSVDGRRIGWHQFGNDHVNALASTDGEVRLWDTDRLQQWVNQSDPAARQYAGGFGYLREDGRSWPTRSADAGPGAVLQFGIGYVRRCRSAAGLVLDEHVYAPFGDDPLLLHDITISNPGAGAASAAWEEYWGLDPVEQLTHRRVPLAPARYDAARQLLTARQRGAQAGGAASSLTVFAAALRADASTPGTSADRFFGSGNLAHPRPTGGGVTGGRPTAFTFDTPVRVPAGGSVTLRYAYGIAPAAAVPALVDRYGGQRDPLRRSQGEWRAWVPQVWLATGRQHDALAREAAWDAAFVRSGATYDATCGHHVLSQGGYYQYGIGLQIATRDPLQHALSMVWTDPSLALEVLRYTARLQNPRTHELPFGVANGCQPLPNQGSDDLDVWLLLLAAEYGLATRNLAAFDAPLPGVGGTSAALWPRLKAAVAHQESLRGPHGGYLVPAGGGDWSDGAGDALGMTESLLVTAQLAYVYPRLAGLADARGDRAFAGRLHRLGRRAAATVRSNLAPGGWVQRGWDHNRPIGVRTLFGEPQGWALLSGALTPAQQTRLIHAVRQYLTGVGQPARLGGRARIGSAQVPPAGSPAGRERSDPFPVVGAGAAAYLGGVWYAVNGWLTWGLASADGVVPHARADAYDEWRRNSLAAHATAYPHAWSGVLSSDDACAAQYAPHPARCGLPVTTEIDTLNLHQPAWFTWNLAQLAGLHGTASGYRIAPHLRGDFRVAFPRAEVQRHHHGLSGFLRPASRRTLTVEVMTPVTATTRLWVNRRRTPFVRISGGLAFQVTAMAGHRLKWRVRP